MEAQRARGLAVMLSVSPWKRRSLRRIGFLYGVISKTTPSEYCSTAARGAITFPRHQPARRRKD